MDYSEIDFEQINMKTRTRSGDQDYKIDAQNLQNYNTTSGRRCSLVPIQELFGNMPFQTYQFKQSTDITLANIKDDKYGELIRHSFLRTQYFYHFFISRKKAFNSYTTAITKGFEIELEDIRENLLQFSKSLSILLQSKASETNNSQIESNSEFTLINSTIDQIQYSQIFYSLTGNKKFTTLQQMIVKKQDLEDKISDTFQDIASIFTKQLKIIKKGDRRKKQYAYNMVDKNQFLTEFKMCVLIKEFADFSKLVINKLFVVKDELNQFYNDYIRDWYENYKSILSMNDSNKDQLLAELPDYTINFNKYLSKVQKKYCMYNTIIYEDIPNVDDHEILMFLEKFNYTYSDEANFVQGYLLCYWCDSKGSIKQYLSNEKKTKDDLMFYLILDINNNTIMIEKDREFNNDIFHGKDFAQLVAKYFLPIELVSIEYKEDNQLIKIDLRIVKSNKQKTADIKKIEKEEVLYCKCTMNSCAIDFVRSFNKFKTVHENQVEDFKKNHKSKDLLKRHKSIGY